MKECFKCGETKPLDDFYRHPAMKDGHVNKCKECNKRDVRKNRAANVEYYRAYDTSRKSRLAYDPEAARVKRQRDKEKFRARRMVAYQVSKGNLVAEPCSNCGSENHLHAHHDDYSKPLNVRWLCAACHSQHHTKVNC